MQSPTPGRSTAASKQDEGTAMVSDQLKGAAEFVPEGHELSVLRNAVQRCQGCELYRGATQAVFGEEMDNATHHRPIDVMMVGEQPGDKEDLAGHPFVGPAGKLLNRCLNEAGVDPERIYITNAVKHFKWEPRGKIRLHKKPSIREVKACKPWLEAELDAVKPKLIVCLGATAAQAFLGPGFRISEGRGHSYELNGAPRVLATVHPAAILRARPEEEREKQTAEFVADLRRIHGALRVG